MSERHDPPGEPDAARLDALLAQARWPEISGEAMARLEARLDDLAAPPMTLNPRRRLHPAWIIAGLAAALAVSAGIWLMFPETARRPGPMAAEPALDDAPAPRLHHADLPGRPPTSLEMAMVLAMHQPERTPATRPTTAQVRRQAGVMLALSRSRLAPPATEPGLANTPMSLSHALTVIESDSIDDEDRAAALQRISAGVIYARMQEPATPLIRARLSLALAQCPDPAAPALLLDLAREQPGLARQAVAQAPGGAPAVLRLVNLLDSPSVPQRESAALTLAASNDPAVYRAIQARLQYAGGRREALMALLMSDSEIARALIHSAEAHPELRAAVLSLRAQGAAPPPRQPQPVAL